MADPSLHSLRAQLELDDDSLARLGYVDPDQQAAAGAIIDDFLAREVRDRGYILKRVKRGLANRSAGLGMREQPAPLEEAVDAREKDAIKGLEKARSSMQTLLRSPIAVAGALMPDASPAGSEEAAMPVGGVLATRNAIVPAATGLDIACSLQATFYVGEASVSEELDALVESTRFGPGGRAEGERIAHPVTHEPVWENGFLKGLRSFAEAHIADQGDGNHFAFLGEVEVSDGLLSAWERSGHSSLAAGTRHCGARSLRVLVTHHGSRGLGAQVFKRGMKVAVKATRKLAGDIPENASWLALESDEGKEYWDALQYVERWTQANHSAIHSGFLDRIAQKLLGRLDTTHNFLWRRGDRILHGKGATPAWPMADGAPRLGLIPLNLAAPILITAGGNAADYLGFAPHGAGRHVSRTRYRERLYRQGRQNVVETLRQQLEALASAVETRWYLGEPDLGEFPLAYKNPHEIERAIARFQLATVVATIRPRGTVMAGSRPRAGDEPEPLTPKQRRQLEHRAERRKQKQRRLNPWDNE